LLIIFKFFDNFFFSRSVNSNEIEKTKNNVIIIDDDEEIDNGKEMNGPFRELREFLASILYHIIFRLFIVLLIFIDMIIVILAVSLPQQSNGVELLDKISLAFIIIFMIELMIRIFVELNNFSSSWLNLLDGLIIIISFIINVLILLLDTEKDYKLFINS
jgi:hypothetical protein